MLTQSKDNGPAGRRVGLALAAAFVATLATWNSAQAQEQSQDAALLVAQAAQTALADGSEWRTTDPAGESVLVRANPTGPDSWTDFRKTVAGAAVPSCLDPDALSNQEVAAEGLLRPLLLMRAVANDGCR